MSSSSEAKDLPDIPQRRHVGCAGIWAPAGVGYGLHGYPTILPPHTHIRHSPNPSSPTSVPRLPRLRSGTQGSAATPTNALHNHTRTPANHPRRGRSRTAPVRTGNAATPPTSRPSHNRHFRDPSCRTPIRYPWWGAGRARIPPPTCRPLPTSGIPPNRLPRRRSGTQGSAATPTNPLHNHTPTLAESPCRGASCGHPPGRTGNAATPTYLPPLTHNRHSPNPSCRTPIRYPWWGAGRARIPPPTSRPLPTSGIPPNRLPRRRSGTQGSAATHFNLRHIHTPAHRLQHTPQKSTTQNI